MLESLLFWAVLLKFFTENGLLSEDSVNNWGEDFRNWGLANRLLLTQKLPRSLYSCGQHAK